MTAGEDLPQRLLRAVELQRGGDFTAAEAIYRAALAAFPDHPETCFLLGQLCMRTGRAREGIDLLREASERAPDNWLFSLELADACLSDGDAETAATLYRQVLDREPASVDALCGLGCALAERGQVDDAEGVLRMAVACDPSSGRAAAGLGSILLRAGRWSEAVQRLEQARSMGHRNAAALNDLGVALQHLGRHDEAERAWRAALAIDPGDAPSWMNLGNRLRDEGDVASARDCYAQVLRIQPTDCLRVRMATLLPPVYASREEMRACRSAYTAQLDALLAEPLRACDPVLEGGHNNFYLCYQGEDDRVLQLKLAQVYRRMYAPRCREAPRRGAGGRIRVGFVSAFFSDHTIGELNRGIIANLDRTQFEVFVFSVGRHDDPTARIIESHAEHYRVLPPRLPEAEAEIAACGLDVLLYTDIGMEPFTYFLAFSRLARVQCVTWGHPVTTGIDTIDYYLSSTWQEPENAEGHYSEKLVRLGLLPVYYYRAMAPGGKTRAELGFSDASHLYVCPQSLFKFHPDFDELLQGILETDPSGQILVPEGHCPQWTEKLRTRFRRVMPGVAERICFLPRQGYVQYLQLLQNCDVMLDPLHFGGGKTTLDALSLGVPIVTLPGQFMRGRATYACYRQMGFDGCAAADAADYVRKAVRLANDPDFQDAAVRELRQRSHFLAERSDLVRELEAFLKSAVESA